MTEWEKKALIDKRQKNGTLAPVFAPSFTCYHEPVERGVELSQPEATKEWYKELVK